VPFTWEHTFQALGDWMLQIPFLFVYVCEFVCVSLFVEQAENHIFFSCISSETCGLKNKTQCVIPYVCPVRRRDGRIGHMGICEMLYVHNARVNFRFSLCVITVNHFY